MNWIASLPALERRRFIEGLTLEQKAALAYRWSARARDEQLAPSPLAPSGLPWRTWLILAGRGWGKTRTGAEWVRNEVEAGRTGRIALVAETAADARDVMVEGPSGLLAISPPWNRPKYEPSKRRVTWESGATATLFNAVEPDQLRGPQFDGAWADEVAKWRYAQETWDQLQFGLRLSPPGGGVPRQVVTTTPRPIPLVRALLKDKRTVLTRGSTLDNALNLSSAFLDDVTARYAGTRLGRQELEAEILDDVPGALFTRAMMDAASLQHGGLPDMARVVVAIDPSGTRGGADGGDDIGIVVAGKGVDGRGYILADRTCKLSPAAWGARACQAYHEFGADRIVAERNFGGAMVEAVIRSADPSVAYKEVTASRGKAVRAEPVAALYEQGRVSHVAGLAALEDQMCQMAGDGFLGEGSPDRLDAAVWALTDLMLGESDYDPEMLARLLD